MNYDRVILEMLDRISLLEEEIRLLKEKSGTENESLRFNLGRISASGNTKDTTKYLFDGKKYGKNRLAHAIVSKYISEKSTITAIHLMTIFDKSLQGSLGVVRTVEDAQKSYADPERRFFMRPDEVIHTSTDNCVVCSQWGSFNIGNLVVRARDLGFVIKEI